jgi:hypothetical protein
VIANQLVSSQLFWSVLPTDTTLNTTFSMPSGSNTEIFIQHYLIGRALAFVRLWRDQGKARQAGELLAPDYGWFSKSLARRDLKEAKALLEELGA